MAAATEAALAHPADPLAADLRLALGGGAVLFVCGTAAAVRRATGRWPIWRSSLMPVAAVAVFAAGQVPIIALGILLAALMAVAAIEDRQTRVATAAHPSH